MAIALVGSAGTVVSGASPQQVNFGQATTAGNLLVAWVTTDGSGAATVTCDDANWTQAISQFASTNATRRSEIWYRKNCGSSETAPTFTSVGSNFNVRAAEFSGADTASPLELTDGATGTTSPQTAVNASADAASGDLVIACQVDALTKSGTVTTSHTYNNGATASAAANNDATSTATHYRFDYGITTSNGSADQVQASDDSMNLSDVTIAIASFKVASAATQVFSSQQRQQHEDPFSLQVISQSVPRSSVF